MRGMQDGVRERARDGGCGGEGEESRTPSRRQPL
eukprot:COSAG01_NODE_3135_length_6528_cov_7.013841_3_plen_34_part_00